MKWGPMAFGHDKNLKSQSYGVTGRPFNTEIDP